MVTEFATRKSTSSDVVAFLTTTGVGNVKVCDVLASVAAVNTTCFVVESMYATSAFE